MRPRLDEQLEGVRRVLNAVIAEEDLSPASAEALTGASRTLRRLELSWSRLLPFLVADNHATAEMLEDLAVLLPAALSAEVRAAVARTPARPDPAALDVVAADERNMALRELLARVVAALPPDETGAAARRQVAAHLRRRTEADPNFSRSDR